MLYQKIMNYKTSMRFFELNFSYFLIAWFGVTGFYINLCQFVSYVSLYKTITLMYGMLFCSIKG